MTARKPPRVGIIDGGAAYHLDSFERPPLKRYFDRVIYLRDLPVSDLSDLDILIVPCRTNPYWLTQVSLQLQGFMAQGGTLAVMGETAPDRWLPDIVIRPVETNFWWWLEPGADLGLRMCAPGHSMNRYITRTAATFHLHGVFPELCPSQRPLIATKEGECLMFEDLARHAPGRLIATTFDPFFHHGQFFMPATTAFLEGLLPWLIDSHDAEEMLAARQAGT
ncbi:MAG: hypothetical protein ACK5IB_05310 [Qingshengfaniella sp.]